MKDASIEREKLIPIAQPSVQVQKGTFLNSLYVLVCSVQFFSMLLLTAQQVAMPFLVRQANKSKFLPTTSVFLMEIIKLVFCCSVTAFKSGSIRKLFHKLHNAIWKNKIETAKVCVPAVVYAIQNNLYYVALANIDATTYSVTYQLRILTTAVLAASLLKKEFTTMQWGALVMSLLGVVIVQLDKPSANAAHGDGSTPIGILATISMCWTSAFAGVYFEKMLKGAKDDFWIQNIRLSLLTLVFATFTMFSTDGAAILEGRMLQGWTSLVWTITALNALGGIAVSLVMKHADNVKKTYCQTIAIGGTALISIFIGERYATVALALGIVLVCVSLAIYSLWAPAPTHMPLVNEGDDEEEDIEHLQTVEVPQKSELLEPSDHANLHKDINANIKVVA